MRLQRSKKGAGEIALWAKLPALQALGSEPGPTRKAEQDSAGFVTPALGARVGQVHPESLLAATLAKTVSVWLG